MDGNNRNTKLTYPHAHDEFNEADADHNAEISRAEFINCLYMSHIVPRTGLLFFLSAPLTKHLVKHYPNVTFMVETLLGDEYPKYKHLRTRADGGGQSEKNPDEL